MPTVNLDEIADNDPNLRERVQYPIEWTEIDEEEDSNAEMREKAVSRIESVDPENLVVLVGDFGDCDGKGTAGVLKAKYADTDTEVVYVPASHRTETLAPLKSLRSVKEVIPEGVPVYYTDLSPQSEQEDEYVNALTALAETNPVYVRDHHPWPESVKRELEGVVESLVVDDDQQNPVCATQIVIREDWPDAPDYIKELGEVTAIRDLWKKDQFDDEPRSADLADYAFVADYGEYSDVVAEYGADIRDVDEIRELIEGRQQEKEDRILYAADNFTDWFEVGNWKVALTYGNCYRSGLGSELVDRGADLVGIVKTNGEVSMRSSKDAPLAYQVASSLNGGGHPEAAGCDPDVVVDSERYKRLARGNDTDEEIPYVRYHEHWNSAGQFTKRVMLSHILQALNGIETITDLEYVDDDGNVDMSLLDDEEAEGDEEEAEVTKTNGEDSGTEPETSDSDEEEREEQPSLADF